MYIYIYTRGNDLKRSVVGLLRPVTAPGTGLEPLNTGPRGTPISLLSRMSFEQCGQRRYWIISLFSPPCVVSQLCPSFWVSGSPQKRVAARCPRVAKRAARAPFRARKFKQSDAIALPWPKSISGLTDAGRRRGRRMALGDVPSRSWSGVPGVPGVLPYFWGILGT